MVFNINGKRFFLTFSQHDFQHDELYAHLLQRGPIARCIIGREHHGDGGYHSHVAIEYERRIQSRRTSFFDVDGCHPNIEPVRGGGVGWTRVVNYTIKDGDVGYYGCTAEDAGGGDRTQPEDDVDGRELALACEGAATFLEWIIHCIGKKVNYAYAKAFWDCIHGRRAPTYTERAEGGVIGDFALSVRVIGDGDHTIVVCGPSGIGKTTWALREAPLPFLLVTDIDDLGDYDPAVHKSIVFDEIRCTGDEYGKGKWPLTSQIKLTTWDTPVSIRIRYKVAHLPAHVVKIFTCTETLPFTEDEQIDRRIKVIDLYRDGRSLWFK